jgi:hypothetical protein
MCTSTCAWLHAGPSDVVYTILPRRAALRRVSAAGKHHGRLKQPDQSSRSTCAEEWVGGDRVKANLATRECGSCLGGWRAATVSLRGVRGAAVRGIVGGHVVADEPAEAQSVDGCVYVDPHLLTDSNYTRWAYSAYGPARMSACLPAVPSILMTVKDTTDTLDGNLGIPLGRTRTCVRNRQSPCTAAK